MGRAIIMATLVTSLAMVASGSRASDEQRFIGFECAPERQMFRVSYHSRHLHVLFNEGYLVDTFYLKKNDPSGQFVESVREVVKKCVINRARYVVRLRAVPGNHRLEGECGGATFGAVVILRNGLKVVDKQFEECSGGEIVTAITFVKGEGTPSIDTNRTVRFHQ